MLGSRYINGALMVTYVKCNHTLKLFSCKQSRGILPFPSTFLISKLYRNNLLIPHTRGTVFWCHFQSPFHACTLCEARSIMWTHCVNMQIYTSFKKILELMKKPLSKMVKDSCKTIQRGSHWVFKGTTWDECCSSISNSQNWKASKNRNNSLEREVAQVKVKL